MAYRPTEEARTWLAALRTGDEAVRVGGYSGDVSIVTVYRSGGRIGLARPASGCKAHTPYSGVTGVIRGSGGARNPVRLIGPTPGLREKAKVCADRKRATYIVSRLDSLRRHDGVSLLPALEHLEAALKAVEDAR